MEITKKSPHLRVTKRTDVQAPRNGYAYRVEYPEKNTQLVDFSDRDTDSDEQGRSDVDLLYSEKGAFFSMVALAVMAVVALVYSIVSKN